MESFEIGFRVIKYFDRFSKHSDPHKSALKDSSSISLTGQLVPDEGEMLTIDDTWVIANGDEKDVGKKPITDITFSFYVGVLPKSWCDHWDGGGLLGQQAIGGFSRNLDECVVTLALSNEEIERVRRILLNSKTAPAITLSVGVHKDESHAAVVERSVRGKNGVYVAPIYSFEIAAANTMAVE